MITLAAISPVDYKKASFKIIYGFHDSPFGMCLVGVAELGICFLGFAEKGEEALQELHKNWPGAELIEDAAPIAFLVQKIFSSEESNFSLVVKGTDLQVAVWKALLTIESGNVKSYESVAHLANKPKAVRAVANAVAHNPISYLIPCHRVIRKSGSFHKYRWGADYKKMLLEHEKKA